MKHTVVIPLYNKEASIYDTIQSLAFQEKKPSEIIIVDDFSTDSSLDCVKDALSFFAPQFLKTTIQLIALDESKGSANAKNTGLELATGELISFLDAGDYYTASCLREAGEIMEQQSIDVLMLGVLVTPSNYYLPNIKSFKKELAFVSNELFLIPNILHTISSPDFIRSLDNNVVIRRKHIRDIRFENNACFNEGIDFWYQVLKSISKKVKAGLLNKACIEVREMDKSLTNVSYTNWVEAEVPLTIKRYLKSSDRYDQQLVGTLSKKWFHHAMKHFPSWKQKIFFILNHSGILAKNYYRLRKRKAKC